jgi:leucyl aminopeptidase
MRATFRARTRIVVFLTAALALAAIPAAGEAATPSLVRIDLDRPLETLGVPIVAHFQDANGQGYVLSRVQVAEVEALGLDYTVIDTDASGVTYLVALERRPGGREAALSSLRVLLDDGLRVVVRADRGRAGALADLGFGISRLRQSPLVLRPTRAEYVVRADPRVEAMIAEVDEVTVWDYDGNLSGENPVTIGAADYTILTRHTASGKPLKKATRYVHQHLETLGLDTSYQGWSDSGLAGRNVVAEHAGAASPEEIVLVTAHLDDRPASGRAPGADDNASGCVGVMVAADILSRRTFQRTIRFVFFTGEEQGLFGSEAYAREVAAAGETIVAVLNLDMIAWDEVGGPTLRLHTRPRGNPGYPGDVAIADTFIEVVSTYGLGSELNPSIVAEGVSASDHSAFWAEGYSAILAIEDGGADFNPYYHTADDRRQFLNLPYFTSFVRAAVGTVAHLAIPANETRIVRPGKISAEILTPTRVLLTWKDRSDDESLFEVQMKSGDGAWQLVATPPADSSRAVITGLEPEGFYKFRVRAASSLGRSAWSKRAAITMPVQLDSPSNLRAEARSPTRVILRWRDESADEEGFEIEIRNLGAGAPWELADSVPANVQRLVLDGLTPETTYRFRVRARSGAGLSEWSARRELTTPAAL